MSVVKSVSINLAFLAAFLLSGSAIRSGSDEAHYDHGLVLTLSQNQASEPSDSPQLKACLMHDPPAACALLTVTLKNAGNETILIGSSTCSNQPCDFDIKSRNGTWEPLVVIEGITCGSNVQGFSVIPPGKAYPFRIRLADALLYLNVAHRSRALLSGLGPFTIRARRGILGCKSSRALDENAPLDPTNVKVKCTAGKWPQQPFIVLTSNELTMSQSLAAAQ
jgi:hypothetical protein